MADIDISAALSIEEASLSKITDAIDKAFAEGAKKGKKNLLSALAELEEVAQSVKTPAARIIAGQALREGISRYGMKASEEAEDQTEALVRLNLAQEEAARIISSGRSALTKGITLKEQLQEAKSLSELIKQTDTPLVRDVATSRLKSIVKSGIISAAASGDKASISELTKEAKTLSATEIKERDRSIARWQQIAETTTNEKLKSVAKNRISSLALQGMAAAATEEEQEAYRKIYEENNDIVQENTKAIKALTKITGGAALSIAHGVASIMPSIWHEAVTANVYASQRARVEREKIFGSTAGSIAGSLVGGVIGGALGGGGGAVVGAGIGQGIGNTIGSLFGQYNQEKLNRRERTRDISMAMRRDYFTYGGAGFNLGQAMEQARLVDTGSINNMRWTSQTLPGAMAFGMVGEQDMMMLSLMPEYFAALMSGADSATLMKAYQSSMANLPSNLRPLVATSVPGGSQAMYAGMQDPFSQRILANAGMYANMDRAMLIGGAPVASAVTKAGQRSVAGTFGYMLEDLWGMTGGQAPAFYDADYSQQINNLVGRARVGERFIAGEFPIGAQAVSVATGPESRAYWSSGEQVLSENPEVWNEAMGNIAEMARTFNNWSDKEVIINVNVNQGAGTATSYMTQSDWMSGGTYNIIAGGI